MAPKAQSYDDVLKSAVDDFTRNGFDSPERLSYWTIELKKAAERTMKSATQVDESVRLALGQIYKRMIERGQIAQFHQGIGRFTIEQLRHPLRVELDKAITTSVGLIKLNREKRMAETLQRFQGWATSIPKGGSKTVDKQDEKASLRKPVANLKFEQRRVEIDQGHKLVSNLNRIIASDGGAIAFRWHSNWRQGSYDYREDHKERDYGYTGNVYLIRNSWAHKQGLVKPMKGVGFTDQITQAGEEPFCRCAAEYQYNLRDLPDEMLTAKGRFYLEEVRKQLKQQLQLV
jgi:hypothetical protein